MLKIAAALLLACASTAMWVGCAKTNSNFLYAAIPASNEIVVYREDPNSGALTQLVASPVTAGSAVQALALHPSKKFLYAANSGVPSNVSVFSISSGGALTELPPRTSAGTAPTLLAMDPSGSFLYVANSGSEDISVFSIDATKGTLTQVGSNVPIGASPLNMAIAPAGNFLYVTVQAVQGYVEVFSLNAGALTPIQPQTSFLTGNNPYGLAIAPGGGFLYTANKQDNSISEFTINADGSLTALPNSPIGQSFGGPVSLVIDPSGKYLYVANQGTSAQTGSNVAGYSVGSDGGLSLLSSSPFGTGAQPIFLANDPSGKYVFVGNQSSPPAVQSFSVDGGSGTLTSVSSYPVSGTPTSMVVNQ